MNRTRLASQLNIDEGRKRRLYKDTVGKLTVGVGRNIEDRGLRDDEIDLMLQNDITEAADIARALIHDFNGLDDVRQEVMVNMAFNLGATRLGGFKKFIAAVNRGDYSTASTEMKDSKWYTQVGERGVRLCNAMRSGSFV